jgi:hypothetical protein
MSNLTASIDLLALQGARLVEKDGAEHIVINLSKARAKAHQNGKVYLNLELIENREPGKYGDTHFVKESTTKQERDEGVKLPIIGNAKPWGKPKAQNGGWDDAPRKTNYRTSDAIDRRPDDGDDVPF